MSTSTISRLREVIDFTISTGATGLSDSIDIKRFALMGIIMPSTWTAANLTFQAAQTSSGTFNDLFDDLGTEVVVTASDARFIGVDASAGVLATTAFIKVRSGTTGTPVVQAAERTLTLVVKG